MEDLFWLIVPMILIIWCGIAYVSSIAFKAPNLEDFIGPALTASFAAFLFCGPFCIAVWYAFLLRAIWLNYNGKPTTSPAVTQRVEDDWDPADFEI